MEHSLNKLALSNVYKYAGTGFRLATDSVMFELLAGQREEKQGAVNVQINYLFCVASRRTQN